MVGCRGCGLTRRQFLAGCAACAGSAGLLTVPSWLQAAEAKDKPRIRLIYSLHAVQQAGPDWPNKGFDFAPVMERFNRELARRCKGFEFLASTATGEEQAKKILEDDKAAAIDGYVVFQMNCWNRVVQTIASFRQTGLVCGFPVWRQRRVPYLHRRRSCAQQRAQRRLCLPRRKSRTWRRQLSVSIGQARRPGVEFRGRHELRFATSGRTSQADLRCKAGHINPSVRGGVPSAA